MLDSPGYEYGLAVIVLAVLATINLMRLRAHNNPSTQEVSR